MLLEEIRRREAAAGMESDDLLDGYMKAEAAQAGPSSIRTEFVLRMLGLTGSADTPVGNALRPACSPGQKKRVTAGASAAVI